MRKENTHLHFNQPALNGKMQQHLNDTHTLVIFKQKNIIIEQIRPTEITAMFHRKRFEDNTTNYTVYEFRNIKDIKGNAFKDKWIKETPMLSLANLTQGKTYALTLSGEISKNAINMPYPIKIAHEDGILTKQENTIRKEGRDGTIEIVPGSY